jgi:hypothetical protein
MLGGKEIKLKTNKIAQYKNPTNMIKDISLNNFDKSILFYVALFTSVGFLVGYLAGRSFHT